MFLSSAKCANSNDNCKHGIDTCNKGLAYSGDHPDRGIGVGIALEYLNKGTLAACLQDDRWQRNMSIEDR